MSENKDTKEIIERKIIDSASIWIRKDNTYSKSKYEFCPPAYGVSNTDQSYYEPRSSSIANLLKSAGNAPTIAQYDFKDALPTKDGKIDVSKASKKLSEEHNKVRKISALRGNKGADISELSQLENEASMDIENSINQTKEEINQLKKDAEKTRVIIDNLNSTQTKETE